MTAGAPTAVTEERPSIMKMWPHNPRSVGRVRRFVAQSLDSWELPHLTEAAQLIVSELVTNAVRHGRPPYGHLIGTRFERLGSGVRIEVHDANDSKPEHREAPEDAESGRGLALVDALTGGQWGVSDRNGPGKMVWAVCTEDSTEVPK
ncbi:ATP-binding protein [Streptomyces sp. NBC_01190]|uniref:ATP-binding protein n=1 Tax=Streptomyces sp. NBC_01190 TaxID=2903767 RepID=UPI003866849A|nr:ATP-binding protein [Streptomyces sp. NBC_01190]